MGILSTFGLYVETTESEIQTCNDVLEDAKSVVREYGTADDLETINVDLDELAKDELRECFDIENMTHSIIHAYQYSLVKTLNECPFFKSINVHFDGYENCDDSHLYLCMPNGKTVELLEEGDIINNLVELLFTETFITNAYNDLIVYLDSKYDGDYKSYPRRYFEDDINAGNISSDDIIEYFLTNNLNSHVISVVEDYIFE